MHAIPVVLCRLCVPRIGHSARGIWDSGSRPCSWSRRRARAEPVGPLLSAGGVADAGRRAACLVARCRARLGQRTRAGDHPMALTLRAPRTVLQAWPGMPPIRALFTAVSGPAMVGNRCQDGCSGWTLRP